MIAHRGFSAWIVSEGNPLPEYLVAVDGDANKVSCWVPSEAGKSFSVHWKDEGSQEHSCGFIYLDGLVVPGRFLSGRGETSRGGVRTGPESERPFLFAQQTSSSSGSGAQTSRDAGTITLKIRLVSMEGQKVANLPQQLPTPSGSQSGTLNHYISYGQERNTYHQYPLTWKIKGDGAGNRSFVTFVFRYRPRDFLLSQGIVPMEDGPKIPPVVQRSCAMTRRVVSEPIPSSGSTPSPQSASHLERMGNAIEPEDVTFNVRMVSMPRAPKRPVRYPGEGILDLYE